LKGALAEAPTLFFVESACLSVRWIPRRVYSALLFRVLDLPSEMPRLDCTPVRFFAHVMPIKPSIPGASASGEAEPRNRSKGDDTLTVHPVDGPRRETAPMSSIPETGRLIASKYRVESILGEGGMGVVVAARHVQLGQRVAIKFMRAGAVQDGNAVGRFLREARASVALTSEHVTKVLDVGVLDTGEPYMVMEHLAGTDLSQLLSEHGPLPVRDAVGFVVQACEAVAEAHALGIVHRDLKPSNLFLTRDMGGLPLVKVLDFGISKMTDAALGEAANNLTASGSVLGSPAYMSPEQIRTTKGVDGRSDVWALGVILYELLTRVQPFTGESLGQTLANVLEGVPRPITGLRSDVPAPLANTISRCLERDLARRVQSVSELVVLLLPYAPPEAARSVERIQRVSDAGRRAPSERMHESPAATTAGQHGTGSAAWLRSGSVKSQEGAAKRRLLIVAAVGIFACVGSAGLYVVSRRTATEEARPSAMQPAAPSPATPARIPPVAPVPTSAPPVASVDPPLAHPLVAVASPEDAGYKPPSHPAHLMPAAPAGQATRLVPARPPAHPSPPSTPASPPHETTDVF
jgi:eukaryotic-like serine/threonine-protein kinase